MLHARIARFDVMATVALFWKLFGTKQGLPCGACTAFP